MSRVLYYRVWIQKRVSLYDHRLLESYYVSKDRFLSPGYSASLAIL